MSFVWVVLVLDQCLFQGLVRGYITGVLHAVLAKPAYVIHVWRGGKGRAKAG